MGYWLRGHEGKRNNIYYYCLSKIQLVGQNIGNKNFLASLKLDFNPFLPQKIKCFSLLGGYNI